VTGISVVKNSPNPSGAMKFINFILDRGAAESICKEFQLFCVNKHAAGDIISESDLKRFVNLDEVNPIINDNKGRWLEEWIREITPLSKR
jgi:spermidine/putrescine-binding protein